MHEKNQSDNPLDLNIGVLRKRAEGFVTAREYILRETKLMERQCRQGGLTPEEWVSKFAASYCKMRAHRVSSQNSE